VYELHKRVLDTINGVVDIAEQKQKNADKDAMGHFRARLTDIERQVGSSACHSTPGRRQIGYMDIKLNRILTLQINNVTCKVVSADPRCGCGRSEIRTRRGR
jgi:hypothetical protein